MVDSISDYDPVTFDISTYNFRAMLEGLRTLPPHELEEELAEADQARVWILGGDVRRLGELRGAVIRLLLDGKDPLALIEEIERRTRTSKKPALSDDQLLDFDRSDIFDWEEVNAMVSLVEQPELYRNHLAIALGLDAWAIRAKEQESMTSSAEFNRGFVEALRQLAAFLRNGAFLPGRTLFEGW